MSAIKGSEDLLTSGSKGVTVTETDSNVGLDVHMLNVDQLLGAATADVAWDYQEIAYVGATEDVDTIIYKTGGAAGTTVRTLTFGYDGSSRITSITKS